MNENARALSYFLRLCLQNAAYDVRHALPRFSLGLQLPFACRRQPIELGFALVFRFSPIAGDPASMLETIKRRIERALLDLEAISGNLLDSQQHAVAVQRPE